jgi:hypothetical protein
MAIRAGLSAIRAAAARHALVHDDLAIKVVLGLDNAAKEHPAVHAGVGALEAGVVRLYGVIVILGWVRVGCARLCGVHSASPFLWAGPREILGGLSARPFTFYLELNHTLDFHTILSVHCV